METNEIKNDEMVEVEIVEEVESGSGNGLLTAAIFGLGAVVGVVAYNKVVKPLVQRHKDKKEGQKLEFIEETEGDLEN